MIRFIVSLTFYFPLCFRLCLCRVFLSIRQAVFALVYRTKDLFGGGSGAVEEGVVGCTCDDVMQVACDALDKDQHSEVHCAAACVSSNVCCLLTASMNGTVNSARS